jgi:hypothetical protein
VPSGNSGGAYAFLRLASDKIKSASWQLSFNFWGFLSEVDFQIVGITGKEFHS